MFDVNHIKMIRRGDINKLLVLKDVVYLPATGILESLDPGPGIRNRKCWTLDRGFGKNIQKSDNAFPSVSAHTPGFNLGAPIITDGPGGLNL